MVTESSSSIWTPSRFRLFLTHISTHKEYVSAVKAELGGYEVDGFIAHEDIEPTRDWQDTIEVALAECEALAAFLHPTFHESLWTDQEVGFARSRGVLVIPIRLGRDPYGFIGRYQGLPGKEEPAEMARSIFELLASHELTAPTMGSSIVHMVETAPSYEAARTRVERAKAYEHWTPQLLERLDAAIDANSQVRQSFGVPAAIRAIVAAHTADGVEVPAATSAPAETAAQGGWWLESGAPVLRLGLASSRGDPPWTLEATIHQDAGDSLTVIRAGWVGPSVPAELRPSEVEPRRAGECRLRSLQFDPLDGVAGEPLSIEAEFVLGGERRTQRWSWERTTDFQQVAATIERT